MGQINCNCQQTIQKGNSYQKEVNLTKITQQYDSLKIKNRVYSILNYNSAPKSPISNQIYKPIDILAHIEGTLEIVPKNNQKSIEIQAYSNQSNQYHIGTDDEIDMKYRFQNQYQQDQFKLFIRYIKNSRNQGYFYIRDEGLGLGCFYKLQQNAKLRLIQNMLISFGDYFITININDKIGSNYKEDQIYVKLYGGNSNSQIFCLNSTIDQVLVGGSSQCHLYINDFKIGQIQFKFIRDQNNWFIVQGNSQQKPGTWIYLNKMTKIQRCMQVRLGKNYYTFLSKKN